MDKRRIYLEFIFVLLVIFFQHSSAVFEFDDDEDDASWHRCSWIRNKLKNGRVKIRSRGRVAKFQCDSGYDLAGKRFATCVRGIWNNPIPFCVARGCSRRPFVRNSRVSEMFRGAVLTYECMPGYSMPEGMGTIYCDGRRWSQVPPQCKVITEDPKTSCDFESSDLCGWSQDPTHDFDWKRNQHSTPSGHAGTGPTSDHTFGPGNAGIYLYLEASSPRKEHDTTRLFSPVYIKDYSEGCFVFWYHMYGAAIGGLRVFVKPESETLEDVYYAWELLGEQGNEWLRGNVTIPQLSENFQIIIEGFRGNGYVGDIAIDDVSLHQESCENIGNFNTTAEDLDTSSCRGRCKETIADVCGCGDSCVSDGNCCHDYSLYCTPSPETNETENPEEQPKSTSPVSTAVEVEIFNETSFHTDAINITSSPFVPTTDVFPTRLVSSTSYFSSTSSTTSTTAPTVDASTTTSTTSITTPAPTTTTPKPTTTTPKPTTTTPKPTTTTPKPTTTTPKPTTTTPKPTTTTPEPATTTPKITITTSEQTTTTTLPTTTTPETTTTTLTSTITTPLTTAVQRAVAEHSTEPLSTSVFIVTQPSTKETASPSTRHSPTEIFHPTTYAPETRRTYNLRPRNRTVSTTAMPVPTQRTTRRPIITWMPFHTKSYISTRAYILFTTEVPYIKTSTPQSKFKLTTDDGSAHNDAHSSKEASLATSESQPIVTILSVSVAVIGIAGIAIVVLLRRRRANKQAKMSEDSEIRFLSENEVVEFSDVTALDRHNLRQPLI